MTSTAAHPRTATAAARATRVLHLCWIEARPVVQAIVLLRFVTAVVVAAATGAWTPTTGSFLTVVGAGLSWSLALTAVYLRNGVTDIVEDTVNGSGRPIASGRLDPAAARVVVHLAAAGAVLTAVVTPQAELLYVVVVLMLGWAYSSAPRPLKGSVAGTTAVVVLAGLLTYLTGWQATGAAPAWEMLVLGGAMSAWIGVAGATKDLADVDGDRAAGRRTLPVLLGERRARTVVAAAVVTLVAGTVLAAAEGAAWLLVPVVALALCGTVLCGRLLTRDPTAQPYRTFMVSQYVVHTSAVCSVVLV